MTLAFYLRPFGLSGAAGAPPGSVALAGGPLRFSGCEAILREAGVAIARDTLPLQDLAGWADAKGLGTAAEAFLGRLSAQRAPFAGLSLRQTRLMGVINVTPDSFSDGGDRFDSGRAVADGLAMLEAGAAILDVGGESTRPGAPPVDAAEEERRVVPVVRDLARQGATVSIDSRRASVMQAALDAGAAIINDVSALAGDPESLRLAAGSGCSVVLMHMRGKPQTMQDDPRYEDVALDIYDFLAGRVAACVAAGIPIERIAVDPGIGFGKTVAHNLEILDQLALFQGLGCVVVLGVSRKSFIGRLSRDEPPKARLPGSLAAGLAGVARGAQIIRVHDVAETAQAVGIWEAIAGAGQGALAAE